MPHIIIHTVSDLVHMAQLTFLSSLGAGEGVGDRMGSPIVSLDYSCSMLAAMYMS